MKFRDYIEEATLKDVPKEFMDDPFYKDVLTAKNEKEYKKALEKLISVRGRGAIEALKNAMRGKK